MKKNEWWTVTDKKGNIVLALGAPVLVKAKSELADQLDWDEELRKCVLVLAEKKVGRK